MILVTGASGKTGKALVKVLSKTGSISALVHREENIPLLKSLGAEKVIVGDMRERTVIDTAMQGIRAVYHLCPNMSPDEVEIGKLVIDAARKNGIEQLVYHSVLHPQIEAMPHHWDKMRVEEIIFESGIPFTILQPAPYMQNLLTGWKSIVEDGVLRVPYSVDAKFSFVDLEDLAETARIVLTEAYHKNAIYEIAGTPPASHAEVARALSSALNRDVQVEREEITDWRLRTKGVSEYAVKNLVKMFEYYNQLGLVGNPNVLRWLLKHEPTSLEIFIGRTMQENVI
jgi:NAD(P)H dehydrogenase (quinone)